MKLVRKHTPNMWAPSLFDDFMLKDWFADVESQIMPIKVNIREDDKTYFLELVAPGFKKENFNVSLEENDLKITATVQEDKKAEGLNWNRHEFTARSFEKRFTLPEDVKIEHIDAEYSAGILHLNIPKDLEEKARLTRSIAVK